MFKYLGPVVAFIVAFLLFFVGLVIGLQYNPNVGTALWATSGLVVLGAIYWLIRISGQSRKS